MIGKEALEVALKVASRIACDSTMKANVALLRKMSSVYKGKDGEFALKDMAEKIEIAATELEKGVRYD